VLTITRAGQRALSAENAALESLVRQHDGAAAAAPEPEPDGEEGDS
jgi:hypothetical protein